MAMAKEDLFGMVALTADTLVEVDLDVRYRYRVLHTGRDASNTDDANSAKSAWMAPKGTTPIADRAVNDNQYELEDGQEVTIGPGIGTLNLKSTTGADAVLLFIRIGTPTNSY
jgi:hypothetical protein